MGSEKYLHDLKSLINQSGAAASYDLPTIQKALEIACTAHEGQLRRSGEPYIIHPVAVAKIIINLGMDSESVVAALLHDVVEDTYISDADVRKLFGADIAVLVDGVTKLGKVPLSSREEVQAENLRKMLLAMSQDIRVIIIKLADRLHNMRTLNFMEEQKRRDKALETLEIYAPIAHRLGIRAVKEELEDLAIRYLDPVAYEEIKNSLAMQEEARKAFLSQIQQKILERVETITPGAHIEGRIKSVHGIYRKMYMQNRNFDEIYDIYAVRVIVDTVVDCYNVLGIVHDMYKPIPGRFKDYISTPKPNMYQSLHTTLIGSEGIPFEVQIRTWEMHQTAEYGIAAHWKYKLGMTDKGNIQDRLVWIRKMLENQQETGDVEDLVRTIKTDLVPDDVFVFSPKGDVYCLPINSTVIDFAYAVHTAVGNRMVGAKVGGRIVPIDYKLQTGEIVEILTTTQQGHGPSRDWLKIVRTSEARNKIRSWFKKEKREENIVEGRSEVEREFRRNNISLPDAEMQKFLLGIADRLHLASIEDFFAAIGYGGISLSKLMPRIKEEYTKLVKTNIAADISNIVKPEKPNRNSEGIVVENIDDCLVKISRCCNPLPGDEIIGFITRGHGVSIHKKDCTNVPRDISNCAEPERWVRAYWDKQIKEEFKSTLLITAFDREALLADVTAQLAGMHVMIHTINAREMKDGRCSITITITINGVEHLKSVIARMSKVKGVLSVERAGL